MKKNDKHTEEVKQHLSECQKKRFADPEERKKQSERLKGRTLSEETKMKMRMAKLGKQQDPLHIASRIAASLLTKAKKKLEG